MKIGAHISSSGPLPLAIERAKDSGCECFQIFTSNPKGWDFKIRDVAEIESFNKRLAKEKPLTVFGHTIYLINLASQNPYIYTNSINSLISGLVLASKANLSGVVTHIGSHGGAGKEKGVESVVNALKQALSVTEEKVPILLETDAGSGNHLGTSFEQIAEIIEKVGSPNVGVCLDTCHVFAAGYDIRTKKGIKKTLAEFDKTIGLDRLKLIHLNDSKGELGSHLDRHEEIGMGEIGEETFSYIVNHQKLKNLCGIIETPDNKFEGASDKRSLALLKKLRQKS